jgi:hypothetical protein
MKFKQYLQEEYLTSYKQKDKYIEIFKNPSKDELLKCVFDKYIRFIVNDNDIYAANADTTHSRMLKQLSKDNIPLKHRYLVIGYYDNGIFYLLEDYHLDKNAWKKIKDVFNTHNIKVNIQDFCFESLNEGTQWDKGYWLYQGKIINVGKKEHEDLVLSNPEKFGLNQGTVNAILLPNNDIYTKRELVLDYMVKQGWIRVRMYTDWYIGNGKSGNMWAFVCYSWLNSNKIIKNFMNKMIDSDKAKYTDSASFIVVDGVFKGNIKTVDDLLRS